jgi:hypothetical protein
MAIPRPTRTASRLSQCVDTVRPFATFRHRRIHRVDGTVCTPCPRLLIPVSREASSAAPRSGNKKRPPEVAAVPEHGRTGDREVLTHFAPLLS